MQWSDPDWQSKLEDLAAQVRAAGIAFDIIDDAPDLIDSVTDGPQTAAAWEEQALSASAILEFEPAPEAGSGSPRLVEQLPQRRSACHRSGHIRPPGGSIRQRGGSFRGLAAVSGTWSPAPITAPLEVSAAVGISTALSGISVGYGAGIALVQIITVTLSDGNGFLTVNGNGVGQVTGNGTKSLLLIGTTAQIDQDLASLSYLTSSAGLDLLHVVSVGGGEQLSQLFVQMPTSGAIANGVTIVGTGNTLTAPGCTHSRSPVAMIS